MAKAMTGMLLQKFLKRNKKTVGRSVAVALAAKEESPGSTEHSTS